MRALISPKVRLGLAQIHIVVANPKLNTQRFVMILIARTTTDVVGWMVTGNSFTENEYDYLYPCRCTHRLHWRERSAISLGSRARADKLDATV